MAKTLAKVQPLPFLLKTHVAWPLNKNTKDISHILSCQYLVRVITPLVAYINVIPVASDIFFLIIIPTHTAHCVQYAVI